MSNNPCHYVGGGVLYLSKHTFSFIRLVTHLNRHSHTFTRLQAMTRSFIYLIIYFDTFHFEATGQGLKAHFLPLRQMLFSILLPCNYRTGISYEV